MIIFRTLPRLILALAWLTSALAHAAPSRPNIPFILADDLGFSDLGCYGGEIVTPNLDSLAGHGLRFTQFYNTARCWPSRAALLTGYYAQQVRHDTVPGVVSGGKVIRPAWTPLLPEMLRAQGYRPYHSGKWHVDGKPLENGFDHSYEIGKGQNNHFKAGGNTEDGQPVTETPNTTPPRPRRNTRSNASRSARRNMAIGRFSNTSHSSRRTFLYTRRRKTSQNTATAIAMAGTCCKRRATSGCVLGLVNHPLPPMEREVGPPYAFPDALRKLGPGEVDHLLPLPELTSEQRDFQAAKMAVHAAMIDRMDREIGRVITQLKALGAFENTIIFFASDNGASAEIMVRGSGHDPKAAPGSADTFLCLGPGWSSNSNTPFRRHKTWVHEGGIATPFIVHWPAGIAARGELRQTPGHLIDIVPTVFDLVGAPVPTTWDGKPQPALPGRSLVPAFTTDATVLRDSLWWQHEGNRALRVGNWKVVAAGEKSPWEPSDLRTDRGESQNLASQQPERVKAMAEMWSQQTAAHVGVAKSE